uniref:Kinase suppressor of ras 1 n=1 Tax=Paramormyrops kingsleyae TaxID=1676925 RepID=A0A3B3RZ86_9TELE
MPQCKSRAPSSGVKKYCKWFIRLVIALLIVHRLQALPAHLSLDTLLHMPSPQVLQLLQGLGSSSEDCSKLTAALSCLRSATESEGELKDDVASWMLDPKRRDSGPSAPPMDQLTFPGGSLRPHSPSPLARSPGLTHTILGPTSSGLDGAPSEHIPACSSLPCHAATPPATPPSRRRPRLKPPCTPPPPSRKVAQPPPNVALTRSRSHESQLGHRIEEPPMVRRSSPQAVRRDIGLAVTHRFSTRSWLSQTCQVCQKSMMFGVKCKHCRLKCHNKCTKEAPSCRISFLPLAKIRRTESVPSDINNPVDRPTEAPQFGTLPKAKEHPPVLNPVDSSSNPSSTTSSTPSSPAPFQQGNPPSATPPPLNPSPKGPRESRFNFPGEEDEGAPLEFYGSVEVVEEEAGRAGGSDGERHVGGTDGLDELPVSRGGATTGGSWRGPISRKASQTSAYLQEWDIPFEQVDLGELIGKGRWGRVHRGRWHGEVAVRLLEIDGNNQDHLKLFKKEVMNYRQTRHENVVLFMGACMAPPHLAIITSFCKGRTLYSVVRDTKNQLDINKTRQIAQEIVKGMGYLHAKGIVHKDLKSKNVFHDTNKVVITDFGLFGISGVVREGGRQNELRLPRGWVCYLAPEIVRRMRPGVWPLLGHTYRMQVRDWPMTTQPVEATIWQVGSGEGIRKVLSELNLGKEVTEILSACWSYELRERPSFLQLADMLERLPKLSRRLSHPGHFWKSADLNCPVLVSLLLSILVPASVQFPSGSLLLLV